MERAIQISGDAFGNLAGWMEQSFKVKNIAPMVATHKTASTIN